MKLKNLYRGTLIEFYSEVNGIIGVNKYIICECYEEEYIFQIICIDGWNAGRVSCYIKYDSDVLNEVAVSKKHLKKELFNNIVSFKSRTLKILQ